MDTELEDIILSAATATRLPESRWSLVLAAAISMHLSDGWWADRDAYYARQEKEAMNRIEANILANICDVTSDEIQQWQVESGLSWGQFWQLANALNFTGWRSLEDLSSHLTQAASKVTPNERKPRRHPVRRLKKVKR